MNNDHVETYDTSRIEALRHHVRPFLNIHHPGCQPNVFIFSLPRSGSTWLMELISSQPGFKCCNEPTDLRSPYVREHLGISEWRHLYGDDAAELLYRYFDALSCGRLGFLNSGPFNRYYRPLTHRIVFKIIHGCEDRLNWFADTFNGRIVYLLRHPIAVSLSREVYPTLPALIGGTYRQHFTSEELEFAERIYRYGTKLEQGVLSWCMQTAVPLRRSTADWVIVSYEQLILDPEPIIWHLSEGLDLPEPNRMLERLSIPSRSSWKSDRSTRRLLDADQPSRGQQLIEKWRERVDADEEERVMEILHRFDIDIYRADDALPSQRVWLRTPTARSIRSN